MYLYFEDATKFLFMLDQKGIPHGDRIVKVFASENDPRVRILRKGLVIIESPHYSLDQEKFSYGQRGVYEGGDIESMIGAFGLNSLGQEIVRSLFRFSNRPDLGFCQAGMALTVDGKWLINNPLGDIDGIDQACHSPETRTLSIHLDIFVPESLQRLDKLVGFGNKDHLVTMREGLILKGLDRNSRRPELEK